MSSINQEPLTISDRYCSNSEFIADRISHACRAMFGSFGAGLHGLNGQPVSVCLKLYCIYIIPRLLYGLDVVNLSNGEINKLEAFHKQNIQCLQNLPYLPIIFRYLYRFKNCKNNTSTIWKNKKRTTKFLS